METLISQLSESGNVLRAIAANALLLASSAGTGRLIIKSLPFRAESRVDQLLLEMCLGLNVISLAGVILGMAGAFHVASPLIVLCPGILVATGLTGRFVQKSAHFSPLRTLRKHITRGDLLLAVIGMITLGPALCYPSGWDELVYHNVLPRFWLSEGQPSVRLDLPYSAFPSLCEVLGWLVAPIESLISARLLNWWFWSISVYWLARLLRRHGLSDGLSTSLAVAVACSKAFLLIGQNCYVETFIILNLVATLQLLTFPRPENARNQLCLSMLAGVLCGACLAVKLTAAMIPVVAILFWCFRLHRQAEMSTGSLNAVRNTVLIWPAVMILSTIVFLAPFLARSFVATGNPVFPYFAGVFTDDPSTVACSEFHHSISADAFGVHSLAAFLSGPVLLAFEDDVYDGSFGWQLPLLVGLSCWGMVQCYLDQRNEAIAGSGQSAETLKSAGNDTMTRRLLWLSVSAFGMYAFWFMTSQQARFLAPAIVLLAMCAAVGLMRLRSRAQTVAVCLLLLATACSLPFRAIGYYAGSWETLAGRFSWEEYISDGTGQSYFEASKFLESNATPASRILLLFEHRTLFVSGSCVIGTPWFQPNEIPGLARAADAAAFVQYLRDEDFGFVFAANHPVGPDQAPEWHDRWEPAFVTLQTATQQGLIRPVWTSDEHTIWKIEQSSGASPQQD